MSNSPMIWSHPLPLGWYFNHQWTRFMGSSYVEAMCDKFIEEDRMWKNFANELPTVCCCFLFVAWSDPTLPCAQCPCLLKQAVVDRGRYAPDFECDMNGNKECFYHRGAQHCVTTGMPK